MIGFYLAVIDNPENKSKFEEIYKRYRTLLITVAYRILKDTQLSEDAVHDAFLSLAKNMEKISDKSCIQIRNYLIIIVKNASYQIYNKRKDESAIDEIMDTIPDLHNLEVDIENMDSQKKMLELIKTIDEKYADVLILRYFYDFTDKEIARSLGISLENAKIRLHRGKNMLKARLSEVDFND